MLRDLPVHRAVNVIGALLPVVLVLPFVIFAVPGVVGAEASHVVLSGSMEPTISPGDVVIVNSVDSSDIGEGDIITFSTASSEIPTTHRVIEVVDEGGEPVFQTKGDANEDPDSSSVAASAVEGRVWFVIPFIGHVIAFAGEPLGAVLFMGIPFGLLILTEVWRFATDGSRSSGGGLGFRSSDPEPETTRTAPPEADVSRTNANVTGGTHVADSSQPEEPSETGTYTVSRTDLQLTLPVMGVFAAYALWNFYQTWIVLGQRTPIPIAAAIATTASLLVLAAVYLGSDSEPEPEPPAPAPQPAAPESREAASAESLEGVMAPGAAPTRSARVGTDGNGESAPVDSVVELIDTSVGTRTPIEWRPWDGTFHLDTSSQSYVYASERERLIPQSPTSTEPAEDAEADSGTHDDERDPETESSVPREQARGADDD